MARMSPVEMATMQLTPEEIHFAIALLSAEQRRKLIARVAGVWCLACGEVLILGCKCGAVPRQLTSPRLSGHLEPIGMVHLLDFG
jgi:hypothetical protein